MKYVIAMAVSIFIACTPVERNNPYDSNGLSYEASALRIKLPLAKKTSTVIHRITATLESPKTQPISKDLILTPLGPATGIITTLKPGNNYTLTLQGFDTEGTLLFEGNSKGINIIEGDTTLVEINLALSQTIPKLD